jgi:hypothetical protein
MHHKKSGGYRESLYISVPKKNIMVEINKCVDELRKKPFWSDLSRSDIMLGMMALGYQSLNFNITKISIEDFVELLDRFSSGDVDPFEFSSGDRGAQTIFDRDGAPDF